jgi:hypothetical protein
MATFSISLHSTRSSFWSGSKIIDLLDPIQHALIVDFQILQQSVVQIEAPSMHGGKPVFLEMLLENGRLDYISAGFHDIQFNQAIVPCRLVLDRIKLVLVDAIDVADISEPRIQYAKVDGCQCRLHASTVVVATDNNVFDVKMADSVLNGRHDGQVSVGHKVGDVSVNEYFACIKPHDFICWDSTITTSDVSARFFSTGKRLVDGFKPTGSPESGL